MSNGGSSEAALEKARKSYIIVENDDFELLL
jgi:hypothetical protein